PPPSRRARDVRALLHPGGGRGCAGGHPRADRALRMRVGFVIGGIPSLGHSGSTLASWTIVETLLGAGHEVTAVLCPAGYLLDETVPERVAALERLGATVRIVEVPDPGPASRLRFARSLVAPSDADLLPAVRAADGVREALGEIDVGMAFGIEAIAATASYDRAPFLAVLSPPPGVPRRLRLRYDAPPRSLVARASEVSFVAHA